MRVIGMRMHIVHDWILWEINTIEAQIITLHNFFYSKQFPDYVIIFYFAESISN